MKDTFLWGAKAPQTCNMEANQFLLILHMAWLRTCIDESVSRMVGITLTFPGLGSSLIL